MTTTKFDFWTAVLINELRFALITYKRYLFDTITGFLVVYAMFLVVFFGLSFFAAEQVSDSQMEVVIVGYIMWIFAINAFTSTSSQVLEEAQQGTLEQVHMSPAGFHKILFVRILAGFIFSLVFNGLLLMAAMLTSGIWLSVPWVKVLFLLAISIPAVVGLGYIVGGLALRYKKISSGVSILQFGLIALVSVNAYPFNGFALLPFSAGANSINLSIVQGESFPMWWYGYIFLNSILYFCAGMMIFKMFEKAAMRLNILGHY